MRISRRFKRIVSAMLATTLAFTMTFSTDVMPLADSKQDQLKAEVSAKQAELDQVNAALKEAQSNKENAKAIKSQLEEHRGRFNVLSTRLVAGMPVIHVFSKDRPDAGFELVDPGLEDVYFLKLRQQQLAA